MKSALWSLTALCGVVGATVWSFGGWTRLGATLTPIRITKTVWVTNEVTVAKVTPWDQPLKPLDNPNAADDGHYTTADGRRLSLTISNATSHDITVTFPSPIMGTNLLFNSNLITWSTNLWINTSYITNGFVGGHGTEVGR